VGSAILTTAASTTAGYGMLAEYREFGMLDDRATLVAITINTFFGFVQHVFTRSDAPNYSEDTDVGW
jgi:hypothetical protein